MFSQFSQYQYPQNHDRPFKRVRRSTSIDAPKQDQQPRHVEVQPEQPLSIQVPIGMTREEEERAADALIHDTDPVEADADASLLAAVQGLAAAAQAAMGLDEDGNPLPGNEEAHLALAEAVKRLNDQHEEAQIVIEQAAAAAAAVAAAQAAAASSSSSTTTETTPAVTSNAEAGPSSQVSSPSLTSTAVPIQDSEFKDSSPPAKRFQCPKCERAFARAFNLNTHLATHDPDPSRAKPFPCPYPSCKSEGGRSFSRKHDLQRHVASVHEFEPEPGIFGDPGITPGDTGGLASLGLGTPGKKFRCEACGRAFVRRDACNRHQCDRRKSMSFREETATPSQGSASPRIAKATPPAIVGQEAPKTNGVAQEPKKPDAPQQDTPLIPPLGSEPPNAQEELDPTVQFTHAHTPEPEELSKEAQSVAMQLLEQARQAAQPNVEVKPEPLEDSVRPGVA